MSGLGDKIEMIARAPQKSGTSSGNVAHLPSEASQNKRMEQEMAKAAKRKAVASHQTATQRGGSGVGGGPSTTKLHSPHPSGGPSTGSENPSALVGGDTLKTHSRALSPVQNTPNTQTLKDKAGKAWNDPEGFYKDLKVQGRNYLRSLKYKSENRERENNNRRSERRIVARVDAGDANRGICCFDGGDGGDCGDC